jgi:DNA repair protein RadC
MVAGYDSVDGRCYGAEKCTLFVRLSGAFNRRYSNIFRPAHAGPPFQKVLAFMRLFSSTDIPLRSRVEISGYQHPSSRLQNHDDSALLRDHPLSAIGDMFSSEENQEIRHRSILANFIENVEPDLAEELADNLLSEFGSLSAVLSVDVDNLRRMLPQNENVIRMLTSSKETMLAGLREPVERRHINGTDQSLIDYLIASIGNCTSEIFKVLFLDKANRLIRDEDFGTGSVSKICFYPRTIFKRAFELSSGGIILVHNHPSGHPRPSQADIKITKSMSILGNELEVRLHDHIIIARNGWSSFRSLGLM